MTKRASELIVRQTSPWILPTRVYLMVLLGIALFVFGAMRVKSRWDSIGGQQVAKAVVSLQAPGEPKNLALREAGDRSADMPLAQPPRWNDDRIREQLVSQMDESVRRDLTIGSIPGKLAGETKVSISLSGTDPAAAVRTVNLLADKYARAWQSQWKAQIEQLGENAAAALRESEQNLRAAKNQLDAYQERHRKIQSEIESEANARPKPLMVDNPRWAAMNHRLEALEQQREDLLIDRTAIHPAVGEIERRIEQARQDLDVVPAQIATDMPAEPRATFHLGLIPAYLLDPTDLQRLQEAVTQQTHAREGALLCKRQVEELRGQEPKVAVEFARVRTPAPSRSTISSLMGALSVGLTTITGLGMVSLGAAIELPLTNPTDLAAAVGAPVVGILPAIRPTPITRGRKPRRLHRFILLACGALVLCGCFAAFLRVML